MAIWPFSKAYWKTATPRSRDFWLHHFGMGTTTGKPVSVDSAMTLSTVWSCVRLISETVATLPLMVYWRDGQGRKTLASEHSLFSLLHDQPNADQTACEWLEMLVAGLCLRGNHYSERTTSAGQARSLTPLRPEFMEVLRDDNGAIVYRYSDPDDGVRDLAPEEVFHVRGFGISGDVGLSPISYARNSMGSALAAEETAARFFANGMMPSGTLEVPHVLNDEQRKQLQEMISKFAGSEKAGKVLTLEAGWKFQPISMNPEDAQMLETRAFNVEEVCRWFRVPPFMIGHTEKSTSWGTGLEQQNIAFLTYALRPYLTRIEQAIKRQLIPRQSRGQLFAEFNLEGLLRADSKGRSQLYSTYAQNGIMTRDEMRAKENLPPMPGGDQLTVQSNLVPLDKLGEVAAQPTPAAPAMEDENEDESV